MKPGLVEKLRHVRIAQSVLTHAVRNLHNSHSPRGRPPSKVRDLESILAVERKIFAPHDVYLSVRQTL